jgi:predicted amidohydrolase YtcJ
MYKPTAVRAGVRGNGQQAFTPVSVLATIFITLLLPTHAAESPDTVYLNATVITMTAKDATAEAVAVKDGKILAVGSNEKIRALAGSSTKSVDLAGKTLLPGFYAAHDHFPGEGRVALYQVDLNSPPVGPIKTMDDLVAALKKDAEKTPPGKWVQGRGYDDTLLKEQRHPTRQDLDRASTNHPIWIVHTSGHLGVGNTRALALAKVTKATPNPPGGVIRRENEAGDPNGVFEEKLTVITRVVPGITKEQNQEAIKWCDREYLSKGVTTTIIAGGGNGTVPQLVEARKNGWFHLRARAMLSGHVGPKLTLAQAAALSPEPDFVRVGAVKLLQDGSLQGFTGFLTEPYYTGGKPDYRGYPARSRETLTEAVLLWHRAGFQIGIHGNGDAAIDDILHAFREAQKKFPRTDTRHRIEHCQTPREDQLDAMKELGITPSFFVGHVYYWGDRHRDIFLGPQRAERISPLASALKRGMKFTVHNDTPVTPVNPLLLVWCAVNRLTRDGKVLGPEQRISTFDALRSVTSDAAWQNFEEKTKGTIEPGKFADFVVLAQNPLTIDPVKLKDIPITETIVAGQSVHKK